MDLLALQGTLKSLLQHHSLKAPILQHSASFMVQLSHPHMTSGKTIALSIRTLVSKVMSLLLNTLSRFVTAFLPKCKCLLISWLGGKKPEWSKGRVDGWLQLSTSVNLYQVHAPSQFNLN